MSVEYSAGIVNGFYVKREDITDEIFEENEDRLLCLDSWSDGDYLWVVETYVDGVEDGMAFCLDNLGSSLLPLSERTERIMRFWETYPNRKMELPKYYFYNQVY